MATPPMNAMCPNCPHPYGTHRGNDCPTCGLVNCFTVATKTTVYPSEVTYKGRTYFWQTGKINGWSGAKCQKCSAPVDGVENCYYTAGCFLCGPCAVPGASSQFTITPTYTGAQGTPVATLGPEPNCNPLECKMLWGAGVSIEHKKGCAWVSWNEARKAPKVKAKPEETLWSEAPTDTLVCKDCIVESGQSGLSVAPAVYYVELDFGFKGGLCNTHGARWAGDPRTLVFRGINA